MNTAGKGRRHLSSITPAPEGLWAVYSTAKETTDPADDEAREVFALGLCDGLVCGVVLGPTGIFCAAEELTGFIGYEYETPEEEEEPEEEPSGIREFSQRRKGE